MTSLPINPRNRKKTQFFSKETYKRHPIISLIENKTFQEYFISYETVKTKYILPSSLRCSDNTYVGISTAFVVSTPARIISVGNGLFANKLITQGTIIDYFVGILRSHDDYSMRVANGQGGYAIKLNSTCVLDCYGNTSCKCSMSNSPDGVSIDTKNTIVNSNASMHIDSKNCGRVYLKATIDINKDEEIFHDYADDYIYPIM